MGACTWQIHARKERSKLEKEEKKLPEDFGLDLAKETNGLQKGTLTKKLLEEIRFAIEQACKIDTPQLVFDSYQIIAFCQRMLQFIKGEYNQQIKKDSYASYLARKEREKGHIQ